MQDLHFECGRCRRVIPASEGKVSLRARHATCLEKIVGGPNRKFRLETQNRNAGGNLRQNATVQQGETSHLQTGRRVNRSCSMSGVSLIDLKGKGQAKTWLRGCRSADTITMTAARRRSAK